MHYVWIVSVRARECSAHDQKVDLSVAFLEVLGPSGVMASVSVVCTEWFGCACVCSATFSPSSLCWSGRVGIDVWCLTCVSVWEWLSVVFCDPDPRVSVWLIVTCIGH